MREYNSYEQFGLKNTGFTPNINATIMPENTWKCQRLEGKHTTLQIA
jgi:hypothetical protein